MGSQIWEAIVLGIVQGLTEFLPVSSSGHLEIFKFLFGYEGSAAQSLALTVILHGATALSTVVVFWKEILDILRDLLKFEWNQGTKFSFWIVASMIPAAFVGLLFEDQLEVLFDDQVVLVGVMLLLTGILLLLSERIKVGQKSLNTGSAIIVGLAQAVAILPGISRSGATIATSLLIGLDKSKAAKFSFLMVVPLIFGKVGKDVLTGDISMFSTEIAPVVAGGATAFIVGVLACRWMISIVRNSQLKYFAYYCLGVGAAVILGFYLM